MKKLTIKRAREITGGIGFTRKTGMSFGLPAVIACKVGSQLATEPGSVCRGCYGCQGTYSYPVVRVAQKRRYDLLKKVNSVPSATQWIDAMAFLIKAENKKLPKEHRGYFRWHDTGDIIGLTHLGMIVSVAQKLPDIKFWLPTKEYSSVNAWMSFNRKLPSNLCIRLSGHYVDQKVKISEDYKGQREYIKKTPVAHVHTDKPLGHACPAVEAHSGCAKLGCRRCWSKRTKSISYRLHK